MKKYHFLEIELLDLSNEVFCDASGEPNYGSDDTDDWGNDIWGVIETNVFKGF